MSDVVILGVMGCVACMVFVFPRLRPPERWLARIDEVSARLAAGHDPTDEELEECGRALNRLYRRFCLMNLTLKNRRFSALHRAIFYLYANKLSAMGHPEHGEWPLRSELRGLVLESLQALEPANEPWLQLALITPALLAGDGVLAAESYRKLPPALARVAQYWVRDVHVRWGDSPEGAKAAAWLRGLGDTEHRVPGLTPEQYWALVATCDPSLAEFAEPSLAALAPPAACRMILAKWWDVGDAQGALSILQWLSEAGHRANLVAELADLGAVGISEAKRRFLQENQPGLRRHLILAWDLCRSIGFARTAVKAGFLDEATAWNFILPAARALRGEYGSWRELGDDYLLGYRYWDDHQQVESLMLTRVEWLKHSPDSPWNTLDWGVFIARAQA